MSVETLREAAAPALAPAVPASPVILLREVFEWQGTHSGYDGAVPHLARLWPGPVRSVWRHRPSRLHPLAKGFLNRMTRGFRKASTYTADSAWAELRLAWTAAAHHFGQTRLVHLTYADHNLGWLGPWKRRSPLRLVGTVHMPSGWWRLRHGAPEVAAAYDALVVLSRRDVPYFERFAPGRVHFVPAGIDLDFFRPAETFTTNGRHGRPRCIFCGVWLRDVSTLARVIDGVLEKNPGVEWDLVVPLRARGDPAYYRIARHGHVRFHAGISDEALRELYRRADLLVLPLWDTTANNAVMEAAACGLPILTNGVGGVPDYTDPSFAELLPVGDAEGFIERILRLVDDPAERALRARSARAFAESRLAWDRIAGEIVQVYRRTLGR